MKVNNTLLSRLFAMESCNVNLILSQDKSQYTDCNVYLKVSLIFNEHQTI